MEIFEISFSPYRDLQILGLLFTSHNTPHITLGNEQCLKILLGVCNTKKRCNLSISLGTIRPWQDDHLCVCKEVYSPVLKDEKPFNWITDPTCLVVLGLAGSRP